MPISSVSTRIYDAPDPVMETDLELLAKINTFQQSKFDAGTEAVQNEINNWSLLTNIAKPELRQYANVKLNNLVKGINNLGGVNLGEANNVSAIKSLGYNIYGDGKIIDAVTTTRKMNALAADSAKKLSGKEASSYDPSVADYLMRGYQQWASDGDPTNTKYDGPIALPQGNMNTINTKITTYLKGLKPDAETMNLGVDPKSLGYWKFEGKWLKRDRVSEAISAVTDENDAVVFRAHGWKALAGDTDQGIISKLNLIYENSANSLKKNINNVEAEIKQTQDGGTILELQDRKKAYQDALQQNDKEKSAWTGKRQLTQAERDGIQESLYKNAWRENVINSQAYTEEKKDIALNPIVAFKNKEDRLAQQWASDYHLRERALNIKEQSLGLKGQLPTNLPKLQEVSKTPGENEQISPAPLMDKAKDDYFSLNTGYNATLYNALAAADPSRFDHNNGQWTPKPDQKKQIDNEINILKTKLDNYSTLTEDEKKGLNLPTSPEELNQIFGIKDELNAAGAFYKMVKDKEDDIFRVALSKGIINKDYRNDLIQLEGGQKLTIDDYMSIYRRSTPEEQKLMKNTEVKGALRGTEFVYNASPGMYMGQMQQGPSHYTFGDVLSDIQDKKSKMEKVYKDQGGSMSNSFSVPLPILSLNKQDQETLKTQIAQIEGISGDVDQIQVLTGKIVMGDNGVPKYKVDITYGKTGVKATNATVDVTTAVTENPNTGVGVFFPKTNVSQVYMMYLSKEGSTPFNKADGYANSFRTLGGNYPYQITQVSNGTKNGTIGYKVKIAVPVGGGRTLEVPVKNYSNNNSYIFPDNIDVVRGYMNGLLSDPELIKLFYKEHNIQSK